METAIKSIAENPKMAQVYDSIIKATENIKEKKDTDECVFGVPIIRYARFGEDFLTIVRRMSVVDDPQYKGKAPVGEWEKDGYRLLKAKVICSVACRVKGVGLKFEKRTPGWLVRNRDYDDDDEDDWDEKWISKKDFKWDDYDDTDQYEVHEEDDVVVKYATMYLPEDDTLRILLNNLWSAYIGSVPDGEDFNVGDWYGLDTMCCPTKSNMNV